MQGRQWQGITLRGIWGTGPFRSTDSSRFKAGDVSEIVQNGKISAGKHAFPFLMPVNLLGATVNGKPNFMALKWVSRVNADPSDDRLRLQEATIDPLLLSMPDNRYWTLGEHAGDAWSIGKSLKK